MGRRALREIHEWTADQVLNPVPADVHMGFDLSLNPYRGCSHACRYCYARETHRYLDLGVGRDFETVLFIKPNLASQLARQLPRQPLDRVIAIGTATDPYQPLEGRYRLTRAAIIHLGTGGHPFTITTKSPLLLRDLDLLAPLGQRGQVHIQVSLVTLRSRLLKSLEPGTAPATARLGMIRQCRTQGMIAGLFLAPIIPGLTDTQDILEEVFAAARDVDASFVMTSVLRLAPAVKDYFLDFLGQTFPGAYDTVASLYQNGTVPPQHYRQTLEKTLSSLYAQYRLVRSVPRPLSFRPLEQISFSF